ncbi:MAG TPA: ParA family protein [Terriglobales bacterium]|nr:ParA family protein [Terriglobales bacterium]
MAALKLLGTSELAALLGVSRQAVSNIRARNSDFPAPVAELKAGPVWNEGDIIAWAARAQVNLSPRAVSEPAPVQRNAITIALVNMKGGVGKSTLTANLGWWFAFQQQKRVLLVDLDPQFNLSQYVLGIDKYEALINQQRPTVLDIFEELTPAVIAGGPVPLKDAKGVISRARAWSAGGRLDVIPSRLELAWTLKNPHFKDHLLAKLLRKVSADYELIFIDCPPTESILTEAAYLASDFIIVPVRPDFLSAIGLPLLARSLNDFKKRYEDSEIRLAGILFNSISEHNAEQQRSKVLVLNTAKKYGWYVFQNEISYSDSYPKGARMGKPIFSTAYARWEKRAELSHAAKELTQRINL